MLSRHEIIAQLEDESQASSVMDNIERLGFNPELPAAFDESDDPDIRQAICDLLGRIRHPASLEVLQRALLDDDYHVRASAADAIGKVFGYVESPPLSKRPMVLETLIERWHHEDDNAVRSTLLQTLALLGDPIVRPILEDALDDTDARVRGQASWGISYLDKLQKRISSA